MSDFACPECGCHESLPTQEPSVRELQEAFFNLVIYTGELSNAYDEARLENSKLRELVHHMHECMSNVDADGNHECFVCEYENTECEFDRRMRELGMEVDA